MIVLTQSYYSELEFVMQFHTPQSKKMFVL